MKRLAYVIAVLSAACGTSKSPTVLKGKNFSVPIPTGWEPVSAGVPAGGVAAQQKERSYDGYFLGSIAILPAPLGAQVDLSSAATCKELGTLMAGQQKAKLEHTDVVDGPAGKACQIEMIGDGNHGARQTILRSPAPASGDAWVITCNHDPRDDRAVKDCQGVLAAWKFD